MDNILEIQGLTRRFDGFCLDNVNLSVAPGTITGLVGTNGAGKSTTIKLILNLIRRDAGSIRLFGLDNIEQETAVKKRIGVVFDEPCFHDVLAPRQIGRYMKGLDADWDDQAFAGYLRDFSLPENKIVKEFSRGMKMKLAIAAALSHHPDLLILDEPTSGLDPLVRDEILDIFLDFLQDETRAVILSSHITSDLDKVADTIALLHEGKLLFHEETAESCGQVLFKACEDRGHIAEVGKHAGEHLYLSWETAVERAYKRYTEILDRWPGPMPYNGKTRWY